MKNRTGIARLVIFATMALLLFNAVFLAGYYLRAFTAEGAALPLPPGLSGSGPYPLLSEIKSLLSQRYIGELPDDKSLEYGAARGLAGAVGDPYTVFVEPQSHELETQSLQGEYGGIGVELRIAEGGGSVLSPFPDSPAAAAGLVEGDRLLMVDTTTIYETTTVEQAAALIRGPVGSAISLRVRHPGGDEAIVTLVRQNIPLPSVTWRMIEGQPTIGLISLSRFSDKTDDELKRAAQALQGQGAQQFVLDLRNNGGGILESAIDVAAVFLDGGVAMYETQRDAPEKVYTLPQNSGVLTTAPLAVLVNHNTASAAEIVAGALLDRGRAPLIGQTTYGKGSVQLVFDLSDGSSLHVTAYLWYTPARRELDKVGLPPTIPIESATDGSDAELARAVQYLLTGQ